LNAAKAGGYTFAGGVGAFGFAVGDASGDDVCVGAARELHASDIRTRTLVILHNVLCLSFIGPP
jgi:hypothetical protein